MYICKLHRVTEIRANSFELTETDQFLRISAKSNNNENLISIVKLCVLVAAHLRVTN